MVTWLGLIFLVFLKDVVVLGSIIYFFYKLKKKIEQDARSSNMEMQRMYFIRLKKVLMEVFKNGKPSA